MMTTFADYKTVVIGYPLDDMVTLEMVNNFCVQNDCWLDLERKMIVFAEAKFCLKCGYPLSLETAVSLNQVKEKEQELHNALLNKSLQDVKIDQATDMKEVLFNILKKDPELIEKLKEIIDLAGKL